MHGLTGSARLQLAARSSDGFNERLATKIRGLPGVQAAAGLLREEVTVIGPRGHESVQLIGIDPNIIRLGVLTQREPVSSELLLVGGLGLPAEVASTIGAGQGHRMVIDANGEAHPVSVRLVLSGALANATKDGTVAIALLPLAQTLTGRPGRVTQVLVKPAPGAERWSPASCGGWSGGACTWSRSRQELRQLNSAEQPTNQSTALFAAIGGMVGFLLALNAMLLTVPERRRFIADLRMQGFDSTRCC